MKENNNNNNGAAQLVSQIRNTLERISIAAAEIIRGIDRNTWYLKDKRNGKWITIGVIKTEN